MADPESTFALLERVRAGDDGALETLLGRYLPRLKRWAKGRLPRFAVRPWLPTICPAGATA